MRFPWSTNNSNNQESPRLQNERERIEINQADLNQMLDFSENPDLRSTWTRIVPWNRNSLLNEVNSRVSTVKLQPENIENEISKYYKWRKDNEPLNFKCNDIWEKIKNKHLIKEVITENTSLNNKNISDYNKFLQSNKTIFSELPTSIAEKKPLGAAGEITINQLINTGLEVIDTPLVQMIKDHVNVNVMGSFLTSVFLYKRVVNGYMKYTHNNPNLVSLLGGSSTIQREITFFMVVGAPMVVGALMGINWATAGKTKVILNIDVNNEIEKTSTEISTVSNKSWLFLILNKLPPWLKAVLKYIGLYFIFLFIVKVMGYNSNIIRDISSQFFVYYVYFLKIGCILNFFVVLYYSWRLYIIKMYAKNKEFINPADYPKFIKNDLIEFKEIATKLSPLNLAKFYKHCYFLIFLYLSIVLFGLTSMVLCSMYLIPPI